MTGQSETKHMPGDLSVKRPHDGYFEDLNIVRDDGLVVAVAIVNGGPGGIEPHEAEANAARVVLTWNCHDELVAALEAARFGLETTEACLRTWNEGRGGPANVAGIIADIDAALAKAGA